MSRSLTALLSVVTLMGLGSAAQAANWVAGKHYSVIPQAQRTNVAPGKVEVMEVFSYGCPACNSFRPTMKKMQASLPANAQLVYLPASWQCRGSLADVPAGLPDRPVAGRGRKGPRRHVRRHLDHR